MKITVLEKNSITPGGDIDMAPLKKLGDVEIHDSIPEGKLEDIVKGSEAVICSKAKFTEEVLAKCPDLKYIGLWATGYDNIDISAASKRGITVSNVPGYSTQSVAQHAFAMILNLASNMIEYNKSVHNGDWMRSEMFTYLTYPISEIHGKTLGIIGYGSIGRTVANIGAAFGMKPIIHTRTTPADCPYQIVTFDKLLK